MATTVYHGLDSNSNPVDDSCTDTFYLGEMGMGAHAGDSYVYNAYYNFYWDNAGDTGNTINYADFLTSRGRVNTYGYWFLLGPMLANPDATTSSYKINSSTTVQAYQSYTVDTPGEAYAWGQTQAQQASSALTNKYSSAILRNTIYGDVEASYQSVAGLPYGAGWYPQSWTVNGYPAYELNQQVIIGFIQELFTLGRVGAIYSDNGDWNNITNSWTGLGDYTSHVWVADWSGCNCQPSSGCCLPTWAAPSLGGVDAQIWQYCDSPFDMDAAISLPS